MKGVCVLFLGSCFTCFPRFALVLKPRGRLGGLRGKVGSACEKFEDIERCILSAISESSGACLPGLDCRPLNARCSCLTCWMFYGFLTQNEYSNRRMSDPSSSWNYFQHGSLKRTGVRKSRSELENVDAVSSAGCNEVEASNFEDGKSLCTSF